MPTYELTCRECGHRFEVFLMRLLRESDRVCPGCGSADVRTGIGGGVVARTASPAECVPRGGFT